MKVALRRLASLFHEAGLFDDAEWKGFLRQVAGGKDLFEVLQQDVSLGAFKNLLFAEVRLPFSRPRREPIHEALSTQIRINEDEMLEMLRNFRPDPQAFAAHFTEAGLARAADVENALKQTELNDIDPYEQLLRQNAITPETISRLFSVSERRKGWPYRRALALRILAKNDLLEGGKAEELAAFGPAKPLRELLGNGKAAQALLSMAPEKELEVPTADLKRHAPDADFTALIPLTMIQRHRFLPIDGKDGSLSVALADPLNLSLGDLLGLMTGLRIDGYYVAPNDLASSIDSLMGEAPTQASMQAAAAAPTIERMAASASTVQLVSSIVEGGIELNATDIHLEPAENGQMRVRYRIDGRLRNILMIPSEGVLPVVSRVKVLAGLNVTERRRPQDGHFDLRTENSHFDFRISTLPCHLGEKVVIRILDESRAMKGLSDLGLEPEQEQTLQRLCRRPYGMILATGPTGSGKTSTLYACLTTVNSAETNIVTIEDPVEYQLPGLNQVQTNGDIDLGFATGLRAILRQDPDVIMIGEIRDPETAGIATRAALTGHLVFSTLHSNSALGAFSTLSHLGVPSYMTAGAVNAVVAQRLVRTVCGSCKQPLPTDPLTASQIWKDTKEYPAQVYRGKGCATCLGTGYRGRTALFEIVEAGLEMRKLIAKGSTEGILAKQAQKDGYVSAMEAGRRKILAGMTTLEEVCQQIVALAE